MTKRPSLPAIFGRDGCSESSTNRPIFCAEKIRIHLSLFAHGDAARCYGSAPCKSPDLRSEGNFFSSRTHPPFSRKNFAMVDFGPCQ